MRRSRLVYSGLVSPRALGSLTGWYDFSLPAVLFQDESRWNPVTAEGDAIGSVLDLSRNHRTLIQRQEEKKPLFYPQAQNGLGAAFFDGVDDLLACSGIRGVKTLAVVYRHSGKKPDGVSQLVASWGDGVWRGGLLSGRVAHNRWVYQNRTAFGKALPDKRWHINIYRVSPHEKLAQVRMDGALDLSMTFDRSPVVDELESLGGSLADEARGFHGFIGEVILYERTLSVNACRRLERWLAHKWQIPLAAEDTRDAR